MNLGIIGAPGAGKDTLANYLVENKGYIRLAFADQIKKEYYAVSGYTEEQFKSRDGEEKVIRDGLWSYSAEMKEKNGWDYFIKPVMNVIERAPHPVVITDIRTFSEWNAALSNTRTFMVLRNPKRELAGSVLLGTEIKLSSIMGTIPIFWNDCDNLEETYRNFEDFLGGIMDPDSSKYHST